MKLAPYLACIAMDPNERSDVFWTGSSPSASRLEDRNAVIPQETDRFSGEKRLDGVAWGNFCDNRYQSGIDQNYSRAGKPDHTH